MKMLKLKLKKEEKERLEEKLSKTVVQANEHNRICVILGYNEGVSPEELAKFLRLSLGTVYNYLKVRPELGYG